MADDYVLPRINEECDSVFADPITESEMLVAITGHNSLSIIICYRFWII